MKFKNIKYTAFVMLLGMGMTSCGDFLDKPVEDNYNTENYYNGDASCISGVNYLYNSPWYDFQRGFIKVGETNLLNELLVECVSQSHTLQAEV